MPHPGRIALYLVLGALTTVAVALAAALWGRDLFSYNAFSATLWEPPTTALAMWEKRTFGRRHIEYELVQVRSVSDDYIIEEPPTRPTSTMSSGGPERQAVHFPRTSEGREPVHVPRTITNPLGHEVRFGWPFEALWGAPLRVTGTKTTSDHLILVQAGDSPRPPWINGEMDRDPATRNVALPTGVIPLGLAANSVVYGAAWAIVFTGLGAITRTRRRRRGRCARCGYDVRSTPVAVCPECGLATPKRRETEPPAPAGRVQ